MAYLGRLPPPGVADVIYDYFTGSVLSWWDEKKVKELIPRFPASFERAVVDWAKLKIGVKAGLFTEPQIAEALAWFRDLPRLWETIRPNFLKTAADVSWSKTVDEFVGRLQRDGFYQSGRLGLAPVVIAGVLIVGGTAASLWAIQYILKQRNLSDMIDGVTAGRIPADVLAAAIEAEKRSGFLGGLSDVVKWLLLGGVGLVLLPKIWKK